MLRVGRTGRIHEREKAMRRLGVMMAALVLGSTPAIGWADGLDNRLNEAMPAIVKALKDKGYKNVGVLRFRVRRGIEAPGFDTPLSGNMVTRLASFLIIHGGPVEKEALGVIENASAVAGRAKIASWSDSAAARGKLFKLDYPLAWRKDGEDVLVEADVFLTGQVKTSRDLRKTTVQILAFDRAEPNKLVELKSFTMKTDRDLLRDLGYSFRLSDKARASLVAKRGVPSAEVDDMLFPELPKQKRKSHAPEPSKAPDEKTEDVFARLDKAEPDDKEEDKEEPKAGEEDGVTPENVGGIEVKMLAGGKPQDIRRTGAAGDVARWMVTSPPAGKEVIFKITNKNKKRMGVVLRLNGVNTVNLQTQEPERCQKWILNPGEVYKIRGFYELPKDKSAKRGEDEEEPKNDEDPPAKPKRLPMKVFPFKVLVGAAAKTAKADMGDKAGLIEIDVFEEGSEKGELKVTGKGLPTTEKEKARESFIRLRNAHIKHARLKTKVVATTKREIIVAAPEATPPAPGEGIKVESFDNPSIVAHLAIRVATPEADVSADD
jgi:hypothetical protein